MHIVDNAKLKFTSYKFLPTYYSLFLLEIFHFLKISKTFESHFFSTKYSLFWWFSHFQLSMYVTFVRRIFLDL